MNKSLFRYIWRHSKRDQLVIFGVVLASLPFYFLSLDLPRRIVNEAIQGKAFESGQTTARFLDIGITWPSWAGGGATEIFAGFSLDRVQLLFGLSFLFLFFVLVNGWFKYFINLSKGALGERMLRRMRFELFASALRFKPETLRNVKSSETATIIKDEVEPIGGFIGDAFIQPMFLGTQAATALIFILLQSVWLGLIAVAVIGVQFVVIPRMRRELLRLGRMRQIASRRLAGRVSEVVDGLEAVRVHDTGRWERAEVGHRLYELFDIRFRIFKRKFIVKFMNNLLAQTTPFFFYALGGYFALRGRLDIGQLVAVIAAYRELPPPLKELIDWDQQRLDVQVKYDQVIGYFAADRLLPDDVRSEASSDRPLAGPLVAQDLTSHDGQGPAILEGVTFSIELPARIALVGDGGAASSQFARILAGRADDFEGELSYGDMPVTSLSGATLGSRIAYAGVEPILFPGTLRQNLLYGLRRQPAPSDERDEAERRRLREAKLTGNPTDNVFVEWVDYEPAGAPDTDALDRVLIGHLERLGFGEDVYRFGLTGLIHPERHTVLAENIVEARARVREKLAGCGMADLIEPFDLASYNNQATVAENLLFGVPTMPALMGRAQADHPGFREALDRAGVTEELVAMGRRIAETMTEIFRDLPAGHPLFDQFSFISADELGDFEDIVQRQGRRGRSVRDDRTRLLALPLAYIEPRHRLGILDDAARERLLAGRAVVREMLERSEDPSVEFYDPDRICAAAPVIDNLLFGRVNERFANARERVREAAREVIEEFELRDDIEQVGLDHQVGPAGRLLTAAQRAGVSVIRCVVKRPDVLVLDGALAPFGERRAPAALDLVVDATAGRTLVVVLPNEQHLDRFDTVVRFTGGQASVEPIGRNQDEADRVQPAAAAAE
jgi:putative ABC transport system ATP-binding protein